MPFHYSKYPNYCSITVVKWDSTIVKLQLYYSLTVILS